MTIMVLLFTDSQGPMMATDGQVELMSLELSRIHHKAVEMSTKYRKGKIKLTYR